MTRPRLPAVLLPPLAALWFAFPMNAGLLARVAQILRGLEHVSPTFALSIPVFLVAAFTLIFSLLCLGRAAKPVLILLLPLSAAVGYAQNAYGVIFDDNMILNILHTDRGEALSYLSLPALLWIAGLGLFPALALAFTEIMRPRPLRAIAEKTVTIVLCIAVIGLIAAFHFKDYASVIRNNPVLRKQVVPTYAVSSAFGLLKNTLRKPLPYREIAADALQGDPDIGKKKDLVVLVVGETQRAMNYQLGGYARPTNPHTRASNVLYFPDTTSCGTATETSVPCMFSHLTRQEYAARTAAAQDNLLEVLLRAGVHVAWLDNDSGCKGVCRKTGMTDIREAYANDPRYCRGESCYDSAFLPELDKTIKALPDTTAVIVVHLMGSHGPTYSERYPASDRVFTPDCPRSDIQNCTREELVNTYDNTILFADKVIAGLIAVLKQNSALRNSALIFMSDHGESLGEKGVYLHGLPYAIAPDEQKKIPFMTWMDDAFAEDRGIDLACARRDLPGKPWSHDNWFDTALGLADVRSAADYRESLDVFAACRQTPPVE